MDGAVVETGVTRVVVLGGRGAFGANLVKALRNLDPVVAPRSVDVEDPAALRAALFPGDLVLDAVGPFRERSLALIDAAVEIGFDVIDISDDLGYAERVLGRAEAIGSAGIRVLNACSSVSAVAASLIALSGCERPVRVRGFLCTATREVANPGAALGLIRSVGRPIRVLRDGELASALGWSEAKSLALPERTLRGRLFESADALLLPRVWPTLSDVAMYLDPNAFGVRALLRVGRLRGVLERSVRLGTRVARLLGSRFGALAYEIEDDSGAIVTMAVSAT
ncbi:MAG: saccharopine dehydrogenase NADP-binding domain-containing protein, partial [Planctomycetota bacterium]